MGKNTPSGNTTTTTQNTPWWAQANQLIGNANLPFSQSLYGKADQIGNTPLTFPTFQTYASPTTQQNQAITAQTNLAQNDPTMRAATAGINPYLSGQMLSAGNPYFGNVVSQLGQSIAPSIDSHFNMNGRGGSGANNQAFASALSNTAGQMAYQNYSDMAANQLKALSLSPQISQGNFSDIGQLASAGAQQQAFNQLPISQALNSYFFNQQAPYLQASEMANLLGQPMPGGGTQSNPYFTNPIGSALGTAVGALGLYNMANQAYGGNLASNTASGVGNLWGSLFGSSGGAPMTAATASIWGDALP